MDYNNGDFVLQMLAELNRLLDRLVDDTDVVDMMPTYSGYNGFLNHVVVPFYNILKAVGFRIPCLQLYFSDLIRVFVPRFILRQAVRLGDTYASAERC